MNKIIKVGVIILVLLLLFLPTLYVLQYLTFSQLYFYVVDTVTNMTGLNTYLASAICILLLIPFIIGIRYLFSLNKVQRTIGMLITILLLSAYNLSLYFFTRDQYFAFDSGEGMKWYAVTPDGVKYYDKPGFDPVYRTPLQKVTPEAIKRLKSFEKGDLKVIDPDAASLFNPINGEPLVWYLRRPNGTFEFYDKPGFHPLTGKELKPATLQVIASWEMFKNKQNELLQKRNLEQEKLEAQRQAEEAERQKKVAEVKKREERLKELKSLINTSVISHGSHNIALAVLTESANSSLTQIPEDTLPDLLQLHSGKHKITSHYFTDVFKRKGYFAKVFNGRTSLLNEIGVFSSFDHVLLGRMNVTFKSNGVVDGMVSCSINLTFKVFNKTGAMVDTGTVSIIGPGYSEEEALKRGLEMMIEKDANRILRSIS